MINRLNYCRITGYISLSIDFLFIGSLILIYLDYLPIFWASNLTYIFFIVLTINTIFLALKIKKIPEDQRKESSIVFFSKYFFLLSLIIITINQFFKRQIVIDFIPEITGITIALGFLSFYAHKNKVEKDLEQEKNKEEKAEGKRKKEFSEKFPRINKIPVFRGLVKWMYKEGWGYSVGLILIMLIFLIIRIYLIPYAAIDTDESYTHWVNLGFLKYGELETTISGVIYPRTPIYNFFSSLTLLLTKNPLLSLRLFNCLFFFIISPFIYLFLKNLFDKKVAILSFFLINSNWYIDSIILAGRSYIFSIIFSFFALYFLIGLLVNFKSKNLFLSIIFMILAFFEGHITAMYHLIPLLLISFFAIFFRSKYKSKFFQLILGVLFLSFILIYLLIINPSFGYFIKDSLSFDPSFKFLNEFGSIFSYFSFIGISIIIGILTMSLLVWNKNFGKSIFLISSFLIYTYLVHSILFNENTRFFIYFSDLIIPMITLFSFWFIILFKKFKRNFIFLFITLLIFFIIIFSSTYNVYQIKNEKVSWRLVSNPLQSYLKLVPENSILISDNPLVIQLIRPESISYVTFRWENDDEISFSNLTLNIQKNEPYARREFSQKEKIRFNNFIENEINNKYILKEEQLYSIYSGNPLLMDVSHLIKIINSTEEKKVYIIFSHTAYDERARVENPELYNFLFENMEIIKVYSIKKNPYNDKESSNNIKEKLSIAMIRLPK